MTTKYYKKEEKHIQYQVSILLWRMFLIILHCCLFLPYVIILFVVLIRSILTFLQGYRGWQRGYTTAFCPDPNDFGQTIHFCFCFPWIKPLSVPAFECGVINMILATRNKRLKEKLFPVGLLIWFKWYHITSILYSSEPSSYSAKITSERVFSGNSLTYTILKSINWLHNKLFVLLVKV